MINCKGCNERHIKENMYYYGAPPNPGWYCILCSYGIARRLKRLAAEHLDT